MKRIFLDHAATTPLHPEVLEVMVEALRQPPGNPSSVHAFGRDARGRIQQGREQAARLLGCQPGELIFTSGGTESDNAAILGAARALRKRGKTHVISTAIEHHAVLQPLKRLAGEGYDVTLLQPDRFGQIRAEQVQQALTPHTGLISVMAANNEVGTLQPIAAIGQLARKAGVLFHVDAVQLGGALSGKLADWAVDMISLSAHKLNGPQGVGLLYLAHGTPWEPLLLGGGQERKRRAGTENLAGVAGFVKALELAVHEQDERLARCEALRSRFISGLERALGKDDWVLNEHPDKTQRLAHIVNISFPFTDTETLLMNLDLAGIAAASGSACSSGALERSHVLMAMGLAESLLRSAVRFSFGWGTTNEELDETVHQLATFARRLRGNG